MNDHFFCDETFDKIDFTQAPLVKGEYESCTFLQCNFSNVNLSGMVFSECEFKGCNLSLVTLNQTAFRDVSFRECKMLGQRFEHCNKIGFSVNFDHCILSHSSFFKLIVKKTVFKDSKLDEVDFSESDLSAAVFHNCDLHQASFENTNLEKADFRTAFNYSINPGTNRIKKAKFSLPEVTGLLDIFDIEITR